MQFCGPGDPVSLLTQAARLARFFARRGDFTFCSCLSRKLCTIQRACGRWRSVRSWGLSGTGAISISCLRT